MVNEMTDRVYSEFEVREQGIKFKGKDSYVSSSCVGTSEEELEVKTITKKCRGVVKKTKSKGTGTGTLKESLHIPYDVFVEAYGMDLSGLKPGVYAYGTDSKHKEMSIVQRVYDEDDVMKLKAYPNCIIKSNMARKVENGAEEVAETELEISVMPDDYGIGMYEMIADEKADQELIEKWMTEFTPDLVHTVVAASETGDE